MADPTPLDFFAVVESQRAIRRFRPDPVPDHVLHRILEAATRAPSARGAEPWFFVVVRDPALRARIAAAYLRAWEAARTITEQADLDADVKGSPHYARMMRGVDALAEHLGTVPVLIACCLDHRQLGPIAAPDGTLRSPCAAYASIFPAVQNLLLAARALGLGTTLTTLHRGFEDDLAATLAIPAQVEVAALIPLGYPADRFGPTRRKPVEAVAFLDGWGRPLPPR